MVLKTSSTIPEICFLNTITSPINTTIIRITSTVPIPASSFQNALIPPVILFDQVTQIENEEYAHKSIVHTEANNLKAMAFAGLIRFGEHFQIESNQAEIERIKAESKKGLFASDTPIPELREVLRIKKMDNTVYVIETELLQKCMKSD